MSEKFYAGAALPGRHVEMSHTRSSMRTSFTNKLPADWLKEEVGK